MTRQTHHYSQLTIARESRLTGQNAVPPQPLENPPHAAENPEDEQSLLDIASLPDWVKNLAQRADTVSKALTTIGEKFAEKLKNSGDEQQLRNLKIAAAAILGFFLGKNLLKSLGSEAEEQVRKIQTIEKQIESRLRLEEKFRNVIDEFTDKYRDRLYTIELGTPEFPSSETESGYKVLPIHVINLESGKKDIVSIAFHAGEGDIEPRFILQGEAKKASVTVDQFGVTSLEHEDAFNMRIEGTATFAIKNGSARQEVPKERYFLSGPGGKRYDLYIEMGKNGYPYVVLDRNEWEMKGDALPPTSDDFFYDEQTIRIALRADLIADKHNAPPSLLEEEKMYDAALMFARYEDGQNVPVGAMHQSSNELSFDIKPGNADIYRQFAFEKKDPSRIEHFIDGDEPTRSSVD